MNTRSNPLDVVEILEIILRMTFEGSETPRRFLRRVRLVSRVWYDVADVVVASSSLWSLARRVLVCALPSHLSSLSLLRLGGNANLTTIASRAFSTCLFLTHVDLSDCTSLETIGEQAFRHVPLRTLNLSGCTLLKSIGKEAFRSTALESLDVSSCTRLLLLGEGAFEDALDGASLDVSACPLRVLARKVFECSQMQTLRLPPTLRSIDEMAVRFGGSLLSLDLSACSLLAHIGPYAFGNCEKLADVNLSDCTRLVEIGRGAFTESPLARLALPKGLKTIGAYAFATAYLSSLDLSHCAALETIDDSAFRWVRLETLGLTGCTSLVHIGEHAFLYAQLKTLDLSHATHLDTVGDQAFAWSYMETLRLPWPAPLIGRGVFGGMRDRE